MLQFALPQAVLDNVPTQIRFGLAGVCAAIMLAAFLFLMWDYGRSYRSARIALYLLLLGISLGAEVWQLASNPTLVRVVVGAVTGAVVMFCAPYLFAKPEQGGGPAQQHVEAGAVQVQQTPLFSASDASSITARDINILSDIRGLGLANATKGSSVTIDGMTIANSANLSFPPPTAELANKSNADLKAAAKALAAQLRDAFQKRQQGVGLQTTDEQFKASFQTLTAALSGAILYRIPSGHSPDFNLTPKYLEDVPPPVRRGMRTLLMSGVTPGDGEAVAAFLDNISQRLPP